MRLTIDLQGLQSSGSRNRGIGNYSTDMLEKILSLDYEINLTLLVNTNFDYSHIKEMSKTLNPKVSVDIREWKSLVDCAYMKGNSREISISEEIYREVVRSTGPDALLIMSPFEGFGEDIVWSAPEEIYTFTVFYDAIPAIFPQRYLSNQKLKEFYYNVVTKINCLNEVLAISESAAVDAVKILGITKPKISVINFGVTESFRNNPFKGQKTKKDYFFAILGQDERKNKKNLLLAWVEVLKSHPKLILKIAYKQSDAEKINNQKLLSDLNLQTSVEFLDFVPDLELLGLLAEATCVVMPSFYEGLGLPVLEAYAAGRPCLVADTSALPEICPNNAHRFDPNLPQDIAKKVIFIFENVEQQLAGIVDGEIVLERFSKNSQHRKLKELLQGAVDHELKKSLDLSNEIKRLFILTPLRPEQTGVANVFDLLVHPLHQASDLTLVNPFVLADFYSCSQCNYKVPIISPSIFEETDLRNAICIYNMGNTSFHTWQYDLIGRIPGVLLLHEYFLSGLVSEKYMNSRKKADFVDAAVDISSSISILNDELLENPIDYLFGKALNREILESATSILVHSQATKELILRDYFSDSSFFVNVIELPFLPSQGDKFSSRQANIFSVFGRIHETKMFSEIIDAWKKSEVGQSGNYILRFVGDDLAVDFQARLKQASDKFLIEHVIAKTDEEYEDQLRLAAYAIQLRRSFRGENSGAILDAIRSLIPVIANETPQVNSFPEGSIRKIPSNFASEELASAIDSIVTNPGTAKIQAKTAFDHLKLKADPFECVDKILKYSEGDAYRRRYFPVSQVRNIIKNFYSGYIENIDDVVRCILRSFPKNFSARRLIIVIDVDKIVLLSKFASDVRKTIQNVQAKECFPIFIVTKRTMGEGYQTIHNHVISRENFVSVPSSEILIIPRPGDIVITMKSNSSDLQANSDLCIDIQNKLIDYLQE